MKAIIINSFNRNDKLIYTELPVPTIKADEVLVQVKALSVNPVDVQTHGGTGISGRLKDQFPIILGWDISGVITAVGEAVKEFKVGDEVFGMVNFPGHGKAYAEYVAAPAAHLALKPTNVSHEAAAATTLAALTAYQALLQQGKLTQGQKVLITAAAGGVGHFAVQIAKHIGAHVIGTSSAANKDYVFSIGADEHIDYNTQQEDKVVNDADLVMDNVRSQDFAATIKTVKNGGTYIKIPNGVPDEMKQLAAERGINAFFYLVQSSGADMKVLADLLGKGILQPNLNLYDFSQMELAHEQQLKGRTRGKIVVSIKM
ncbi:NADP-dependent oxidoreductase [Chitinophaga sancti]|uniref:NADP-dependent oxidoreductase n=1 Tax=Chitinophaga sancti TaxID=1004 RepID=UPI002A75EA7D|nr:NADP-dependent oxidoreductase [Chitinophaga sancti]WPQ64847.1 NADP-dependent oxidoreductase [Chitinophaga sancti]